LNSVAGGADHEIGNQMTKLARWREVKKERGPCARCLINHVLVALAAREKIV
jgi:hypothetical protein